MDLHPPFLCVNFLLYFFRFFFNNISLLFHLFLLYLTRLYPLPHNLIDVCRPTRPTVLLLIIRVYATVTFPFLYSSKSHTLIYILFQIYTKQNRIKLVLEGKSIKYEEIDLCKDQEKRDEMREKAGIPNLLPPQLFNGDTYCGVSLYDWFHTYI